jgi:hypothetical protein
VKKTGPWDEKPDNMTKKSDYRIEKAGQWNRKNRTIGQKKSDQKNEKTDFRIKKTRASGPGNGLD